MDRIEAAPPEAQPAEPHAARSRWRRWLLLTDIVLVLAALGLFAMPYAALASSRPPAAPTALGVLNLPPLVHGVSPALRDLPVFSPGGPDGQIAKDQGLTPVEIQDQLTIDVNAVFGPRAASFWAAVNVDPEVFFAQDQANNEFTHLPYRYPGFDPVVASALQPGMAGDAVQRAVDLASLLVVADAMFTAQYPTTAGAAFAILHRLSDIAPNCDVLLSYAFVASLDDFPVVEDVDALFERAVSACPNDPTPLWTLGQFQLAAMDPGRQPNWLADLNAVPGEDVSNYAKAPYEATFDTFKRLQAMYPGSPLGWAGGADAYLSVAEASTYAGTQPFTARHDYALAKTLYERAAALSSDPGIQLGLARAELGLGDLPSAVGSVDAAVHAQVDAAVFAAWQVDILERAHDFPAAAAAAGSVQDRTMIHPSGQSMGSAGGWDPGCHTSSYNPLGDIGHGCNANPFSIGAQRTWLVTLNVGPVDPAGGGAVDYLPYLPDYRTDSALVAYDPYCMRLSQIRDLLLAGDATQAGQLASAGPENGFDRALTCKLAGTWPDVDAIVAAEAGSSAADAASVLSDLGYPNPGADAVSAYSASAQPWTLYVFDRWQNLWRFAGNLDKAKAVVDRWLAALPGDPVAYDRAGEVAFLRHDFTGAIGYFSTEAKLTTDPISRSYAQLKQAVMQTQSGHLSAASTLLDTAESSRGSDDDGQLAYRIAFQRGNVLLREHSYTAAAAAYRAGLPAHPDPYVGDSNEAFSGGALANNLALADVLTGQADAAIVEGRTALYQDPQSPVFLQTLAYAYQTAGQPEKAIDLYRQALAYDPTVFSAANDLGVLLLNQGQTDAGLAALRQAVSTRPDYALGWFNLGVALHRTGPLHYLQAEGALGRAAQLDSHYRDAKLELSYDSEPYFTNLDLSRPLPPQWTYAAASTRSPLAVTAVMIVLLFVRALWGAGLDTVTGKLGEHVVGEPEKRARWLRWLSRRWAAWIAIAATLALTLVPGLRSGVGALDDVFLAVGVAILIGLVLRSRARAAKAEGVTMRHYSWTPAIAFGVGMGAAGLVFAPLPVADAPAKAAWTRWLGTGLLAASTAVLLVMGTVTGVPVVRALGATALVVLSSSLLPAKPFDGAYIAGRLLNLACTAALLGVAALLVLGWI